MRESKRRAPLPLGMGSAIAAVRQYPLPFLALFGLIAGLVACYRGLTISGGGAKAVGNAVNETVVYAFMALFVVNVVVTAIGIRATVK